MKERTDFKTHSCQEICILMPSTLLPSLLSDFVYTTQRKDKNMDQDFHSDFNKYVTEL